MVGHFREEPEEPSMIGRFLSVLLAAGASGQAAYRDVSGRIAALGDDVFVYDAKSLAPGDTLRATIAQALQMPHARHFIVGGLTYKAQAFADAFARTDAALKRYLAN